MPAAEDDACKKVGAGGSSGFMNNQHHPTMTAMTSMTAITSISRQLKVGVTLKSPLTFSGNPSADG
jgi:hypothetical protein